MHMEEEEDAHGGGGGGCTWRRRRMHMLPIRRGVYEKKGVCAGVCGKDDV